ncbi:MAG: mycofactocin-associated electron transfer flavoprotein alpha subunit [Ilumatobacteraceae bacterium]
MIAVALIRAGSVPAGTDEAVCEAGGAVVLLGTGTSEAAQALSSVARTVWKVECADAPSWPSVASFAELTVEAVRMAGHLGETIIVPASPDGRDLAPHVARRLDRPFFAGAVAVTDDAVGVVRGGGLQIADIPISGPVVCTLQVGSRGVDTHHDPTTVTALTLSATAGSTTTESAVVTVEVLPPDAATMDLSEAPRIVGGGAGLVSADSFVALEAVAAAMDASMGVTRVITDRGWASHERQIGTTGVVVSPRLYLSFGISGAVQHTSGLGQPEHIISVNTDPHCPMMQMSDLAIVADANEVLEELASLLGVSPSVVERAS